MWNFLKGMRSRLAIFDSALRLFNFRVVLLGSLSRYYHMDAGKYQALYSKGSRH